MIISLLTASWAQTVLLYLWLVAAMYIFYLWSKMAHSLLEAVEKIGRANLRLVDAGDRLSEEVAGFLDKATDVVEKMANQFTQEFNPLLHEMDDDHE